MSKQKEPVVSEPLEVKQSSGGKGLSIVGDTVGDRGARGFWLVDVAK